MFAQVTTLLKTLSDPATLKAIGVAYVPNLKKAFVVVLGIFIGIYSVYLGLPLVGLKWRNAEPVHLTQGYKDQWVKDTAALHGALYSDADVKARLESAGYGPKEIQELADANASSPELQGALMSIKDLPSQSVADSNRSAISSSFISNITPFICLFVWLVLISVGILLFSAIKPMVTMNRSPGGEDASVAGLSEKERQRREALESAREQQTDFAEEPQGAPLVTFMSAYVLGDDLYDDSFAIEPTEEDGSLAFAGECGIGISETIGVGDPKKVTAIEVWVFDQAEIQTLTYVLMTEHAYNDQSLRAKLAPRGEPVLAVAGKAIVLETRSLKMQVKLIDLEYGEGSLPPNSFFDKVTFALAVWVKEGSSAPASAGGITPLPSFAPPPAPAPSSFAPSPMPSGAPLTGNMPGGQPPLGGTPLTGNAPMPLTGNMPGGQPPLGGTPLTGNAPMPLTGNMPGGQPPLGGTPLTGNAPMPLTGNMPGGGAPLTSNAPRPLTGNMPGGQPPLGGAPLTGNAPPPLQGGPLSGSGIPPASGSSPFGAQQPPMPQRRPPEEDQRPMGRPAPDDDPFDPFGDTNQM